MANYGMQYRGQFTPSGYNSPRSGDQPPPPPGEESAPLPPASEEPVPPPPPPEEEEEGEQSPPPPPPPEPSVATEEAEVESDGIEMEISDVEEDSLMEPSIKGERRQVVRSGFNYAPFLTEVPRIRHS